MAEFKVTALRWWIVGLVFVATLINFMDRLTISVLAVPICATLHLSNQQFAGINIWFLAAYTMSQGLSGKMHDRIGVKRGMIVSIVVWSGAAMAHAFARTLAVFSALRFVLGLGEAGNWPGAAKIIAEWFPIRERALAMGIFNCGTSIGSVVAPPLIVWLSLHFGWQSAFLVTGALGFVWCAGWVIFYWPMKEHPWLSDEERELIESGQPVASAADESRRWAWAVLLRRRDVWGIVLARLLVDPVWWLYVLWLPKYLGDERGLSLTQAGWGASIPFVFAGAGCILGGYSSGLLIRRGWGVLRARMIVIVIAACLIPAGIFVPYAHTTVHAIAWICIVTFGFQVWVNNVQTLPSDLFPAGAVATVAGLGGVGAGIGSIIFTETVGWMKDHFSFTPVIIIAGALAPLGTIVLLTLLSRHKSQGGVSTFSTSTE